MELGGGVESRKVRFQSQRKREKQKADLFKTQALHLIGWGSLRNLRAFNKNSEVWSAKEERHAQAGCSKLAIWYSHQPPSMISQLCRGQLWTNHCPHLPGSPIHFNVCISVCTQYYPPPVMAGFFNSSGHSQTWLPSYITCLDGTFFKQILRHHNLALDKEGRRFYNGEKEDKKWGLEEDCGKGKRIPWRDTQEKYITLFCKSRSHWR